MRRGTVIGAVGTVSGVSALRIMWTWVLPSHGHLRVPGASAGPAGDDGEVESEGEYYCTPSRCHIGLQMDVVVVAVAAAAAAADMPLLRRKMHNWPVQSPRCRASPFPSVSRHIGWLPRSERNCCC